MHLEALPLGPGDSGLAQDSSQKTYADVAPMRVGQPQGHISPDHDLMSSTGIWTLKAEFSERANEIVTADLAESGH